MSPALINAKVKGRAVVVANIHHSSGELGRATARTRVIAVMAILAVVKLFVHLLNEVWSEFFIGLAADDIRRDWAFSLEKLIRQAHDHDANYSQESVEGLRYTCFESLESRAGLERVSIRSIVRFRYAPDPDNAIPLGRLAASRALSHPPPHRFAERAATDFCLLSRLVKSEMLVFFGAHQTVNCFQRACHELAPVATVLSSDRTVLWL
ncbi:hypothetical protein HD806DRAFT_500147 [Xylariaceae sp. AK1471]|nr:hypothetical protein HD806DRAFT_500147 [Xylariaceae sp. AK1471]